MLRQQLSNVNTDINQTNHALENLRKVLQKEEEQQLMHKEPVFEKYYKPFEKNERI